MLKEKNKEVGHRKIRYYIVTENVFIVLAFLLMAVGVYNLIWNDVRKMYFYCYVAAGIVLLVVGISIAFKIAKAFQREDIPIYTYIMESTDTDPETGLVYYDGFVKKAETQLQLTLTPCYLASFQMEGIEHLRHFVGYKRAADTMAEIGEIFREFEHKRGERKTIVGCKSGHELLLLMNDCELREVETSLNEIMSEINEVLLHLPTAETFTTYCGYSCYPQHSASCDELMKNTAFAVYEAAMFRKPEPHAFSADAFRRQETEYVKDNKLRKLLDMNELQYDFQPIVSAKTGKIYAYEALMRTKADMGLSPSDILELAERQERLYEVEHYTFFNVLRIMKENDQIFEKRRLFINSIPTVIIKEEEFDQLLSEYPELMKQVVIEITENGMQSEESCQTVHKYMEKSKCELALDDYGTGYSNASTLLNNSPHYLKIDHSMIMGIDSDSKKQHLVANYISFANNHNMKILAEGVETPEELQMVIQLGVHLIQGFYIAKPSPLVADKIDTSIENEIVAINLKLAKLAFENKIYETANFDNISLVNLALDFYSQIDVVQSTTRIVGDVGREVSMGIKIADNLETVLALRDVNLRGRDMPAIELGENSRLVLCVEGENVLSYEGIHVPASASLVIQGNGNLTIRADHNNGTGIGSTSNEPYGNILLDMKGTVRVETNGDTAIGIGGLVADANSEIKVSSGNVEIIAAGSHAIGIGAVSGHAKIVLDSCCVAISASGADSVGIGVFEGTVDIKSVADIEIDTSGSCACSIGAIKPSKGRITLNGGKVNVINHCMEGVAIGSHNGSVEILIFGDEIFAFCEGSDIGGIGNFRGDGDTYIRTGSVKVVALAANPIPLGSMKGKLEITGGNLLCDIGSDVQPVNQYGVQVFHRLIEGEEMYRKKIEMEEGTYQYIAMTNQMFDNLHIYLPKFCHELDLQT